LERTEIDHKIDKIHCPFCDQLVVTSYDEELPDIAPCDHYLYLTHDMGIYDMSDRFKQFLLQAHGLDELEEDEPLDLDLVTIPDAIQLEQYQPAPSFYGTYFGFAK
jgi:hypothetical protein